MRLVRRLYGTLIEWISYLHLHLCLRLCHLLFRYLHGLLHLGILLRGRGELCLNWCMGVHKEETSFPGSPTSEFY